VPTEIADVLTIALKAPCVPLNVPVLTTGALSTVMVPVPDGTRFVPALSLPLRVMLAVPKLIVCELVRFLNVGVALLMISVIVVAAMLL